MKMITLDRVTLVTLSLLATFNLQEKLLAQSPNAMLIRSISGAIPCGSAGRALSVFPDLSGDGVPDLAFCADFNNLTATLQVFSGADGILLRSHNYGSYLSTCGIPDTDGDGVDDYVIGGPLISLGAGRNGIVDIVSGATGVTRRLTSGTFDSYRGSFVLPIGDINNDGICDIVSGANHDRSGPLGSVYWISGIDGSVIRQFGGGDYFGSTGSAGRDIDGDGIRDVIAGRGWNFPGGGYLRLYSGRTGNLMWQVANADSYFGIDHAMIADITGDFVPDVAVISIANLYVLSGSTGAIVYQSPRFAGMGLANFNRVIDLPTLSGSPKFALGVADMQANGQEVGRVLIVDAASGQILETIEGTEVGAKFGSNLNFSQDFDGDGKFDLVVTAALSLDPLGSVVGKAYIYNLEVGAPQASFITYGTGCAGWAGVPTLSAAPSSLPRLGQTLEVVLDNLPDIATVCVQFMGFASSSWNGMPLPLEMSSYGMPGCFIFTSSFRSGFLLALVPNAHYSLPIPMRYDLLGVNVEMQALVCDPRAGNPLGAILTNAATARIGY